MLSKRLSPVQSQGNFRETSHNVTTTNHQQCSLVTTPATGRVGIPWKKYFFEEHSGDSSGHRCRIHYLLLLLMACLHKFRVSSTGSFSVYIWLLWSCCCKKSCCKMVYVTRGSFFRETRHPWKFGGWVFIWHIWDSRFYDLHQCGTARGDLIMILWQSKLILDWNIPRYQAGNL